MESGRFESGRWKYFVWLLINICAKFDLINKGCTTRFHQITYLSITLQYYQLFWQTRRLLNFQRSTRAQPQSLKSILLSNWKCIIQSSGKLVWGPFLFHHWHSYNLGHFSDFHISVTSHNNRSLNTTSSIQLKSTKLTCNNVYYTLCSTHFIWVIFRIY